MHVHLRPRTPAAFGRVKRSSSQYDRGLTDRSGADEGRGTFDLTKETARRRRNGIGNVFAPCERRKMWCETVREGKCGVLVIGCVITNLRLMLDSLKEWT